MPDDHHCLIPPSLVSNSNLGTKRVMHRRSENIAQNARSLFTRKNVRLVEDQKAVEVVLGPLRDVVRAERRLESCCGRYRKDIKGKS